MKAQDESGIYKDFTEKSTDWIAMMAKGAPMLDIRNALVGCKTIYYSTLAPKPKEHRKSLILSWIKLDKNYFTKYSYEPNWQISLGLRASGQQKKLKIAV